VIDAKNTERHKNQMIEWHFMGSIHFSFRLWLWGYLW